MHIFSYPYILVHIIITIIVDTMVPSLAKAALAALSLCGLVYASPLPSAQTEVQARQSSGYKNMVYFTNW